MTIVVSGNLRRFTGFESEVELDADSVPTALGQLVERFPQLRPVVLDSDGNLRQVHRLYLNGELLDRGDAGRALAPNDELGILTAIAGG